ncbi:hypothetical protein EVAR_82713_1 [Eumeta japonica]|uniref:Uncharacterized protein n=1 Tax=Eumeta variegata TaxID=151549 RepID=A0A4C1YFX2_EUMVA|nr:hypothetical protein EVAR_82713_1 [Eumeta japonica]
MQRGEETLIMRGTYKPTTPEEALQVPPPGLLVSVGVDDYLISDGLHARLPIAYSENRKANYDLTLECGAKEAPKECSASKDMTAVRLLKTAVTEARLYWLRNHGDPRRKAAPPNQDWRKRDWRASAPSSTNHQGNSRGGSSSKPISSEYLRPTKSDYAKFQTDESLFVCLSAKKLQGVFTKCFACENNDDVLVTQLFVDPSGKALGASLMQKEKKTKETRLLVYVSRKFSDLGKKRSTTEPEEIYGHCNILDNIFRK